MSNRSVAGPSSFMDENGKTDTDLTVSRYVSRDDEEGKG